MNKWMFHAIINLLLAFVTLKWPFVGFVWFIFATVVCAVIYIQSEST